MSLAFNHMGINLLDQSRLAEAESAFRASCKLDPKHAHSLHSLGLIAHQAGRNDLAADIIGQAIALNDRVPAFHNNLGNAFQAQGRLTGATESYRRALILDQTFAVAHYNLGNVLRQEAKFTEAAECYRQASRARGHAANRRRSFRRFQRRCFGYLS